VNTAAKISPSAFPTHHLNTNKREKEVRYTTSAEQFSAMPTGEGNPSSSLSLRSNPGNVGYLTNFMELSPS
jgi:hypothetical protein